MKTRVLVAAVSILCAFSIAGCPKEAQKDLGEAGANVGQATEKTAEATGQAVEKTGEAIGNTAEKAAEATGQAVENAGEAVGGAAKAAGDAVETGVENAGEAVGGAVKGAQQGVTDAAQSAALTPKIKNALVADKQIDASTIDVDTSGEANTVILKGTVRSAAEKTRAATVAQKALTDAKSTFKLRNDLTVAKQ